MSLVWLCFRSQHRFIVGDDPYEAVQREATQLLGASRSDPDVEINLGMTISINSPHRTVVLLLQYLHENFAMSECGLRWTVYLSEIDLGIPEWPHTFSNSLFRPIHKHTVSYGCRA